MTPLVIVRVRPGQAPDTAGLRTLGAASILAPATVLVAGRDCQACAAEFGRRQGVARVVVADHPGLDPPFPERLAPLVADCAEGHSHLLAPADSFGRALLPRVAALLGVAMASEVTAILDGQTVICPTHAGNIHTRIRLRSRPVLLTVRTHGFAAPQPRPGAPAPLDILTPAPEVIATHPGVRLLAFHPAPAGRPELSYAERVVAGGQGLEAGGDFAPIEALADQLGAAVGATRGAVDAGLAPNDWQVGQTGKIIAPRLYIGVGLSGAIQHLAGIKDAGTIVAINHDPQAPIHKAADLALVADLYQALPEMIRLLRKLEGS
ncbi:MAG: electron transfer flavoprotein subunit alpha/FixB family protein [Magnetococcales bacterium]|nr:electron transfer flavoprotein subunit alpha/FixB family protein [Magnetococcales bacterium]